MKAILKGGPRHGDVLEVGQDIKAIETVQLNKPRAEPVNDYSAMPTTSFSTIVYHRTAQRESGAVVFKVDA